MAEEKSGIVNEIIRRAFNIANNNTGNLIKNYKITDDSGQITIAEARKPIEELKEILKLVSYEALILLPDRYLAELNKYLNPIFGNLERLHNYRVLRDQTIENQQNQLRLFYIDGSADGMSKYLDQAWPIIVASLSLLSQSDGKETGSSNLNEIKENFNESSRLLGDLHSILNTAKHEITEAGVSKHAAIFMNQSDLHRTNGLKWRNALILLMVLNFLLIVGLFFIVIENKTERIEIGISGVLLISLVSYCIVLSARHFFAEKHNQIINKHKANCLDSYNTFIEGASEDVKSAILQFTTQTIFSTYNTGFLNKESIQSPSPILEILRTMGPSKT